MTADESPATSEDEAPQPAGVADEQFAVRVREERERKRWSQADVARLMSERNWKWHPQTVQKIENGNRKVTVGEAKALAAVFETTVDRLTSSDEEASAIAVLIDCTARAERAREEIRRASGDLQDAQSRLAAMLSHLEKKDYLDSEEIRELAAEAFAVLKLSPAEVAASGPGQMEAEQ